MGENKHIKELDAFAKKYIKEISAEKPTKDFTSSVMQNVLLHAKTSKLEFKPLISKKVWFVIVVAFLSILFIPFRNSEKEIINLPEVDFSFLSKFQISGLLETLSISSTTFYTFLFFGIMIFIQIMYLKNHFDKKLS